MKRSYVLRVNSSVVSLEGWRLLQELGSPSKKSYFFAGQARDARHSGPRGEDCETSAVLRQKTGRHPSVTPLVLFLKDQRFPRNSVADP